MQAHDRVKKVKVLTTNPDNSKFNPAAHTVKITESSKLFSNLHTYAMAYATFPITKHASPIKLSDHSTTFIMEEQTSHRICYQWSQQPSHNH